MNESDNNETPAGDEKSIFSRQELFDLVWSIQMETLAKQLGQSIIALRRKCIDLSIPLPRPEYWGKTEQAKAAEKPELPVLPAGKKQEVELTRPAPKAKRVRVPPPVEAAPVELDPLLFAVQQTMTRKDAPTYEGIRRSANGQVSISVTPANIERAIRFMNHFLYAFRGKGYTIEIDDSETKAIIDGQEIFIRCNEKFRRVRVKGPYGERSELQLTGLLAFHIKCGSREREWTEENGLLEAQVPNMLEGMERMAKRHKEEETANAAMRAERDEKRRLEEEKEQKKESELANFKGLLGRATRWQQANMLRDYVATVEEKALAEERLTPELKDWISWARAKADWYDPLVGAADEWMTEVDKATLRFKDEQSFEEKLLSEIRNLRAYAFYR